MTLLLRYYGPLMTTATLVVAGALAAVAAIAWVRARKGKAWRAAFLRAACWILLVVGAATTAIVTLPPRLSPSPELVPWALWTSPSASAHDTVANVILLTWLGFALPVLDSSRWRLGRVVTLLLVVSVAIELAQAVLPFGRVVSLSDVLLNVLGGSAAALVSTRWLAPAADRFRRAEHTTTTAAGSSSTPDAEPSTRAT